MNAGTLTQALTASRYKANPTAGSREKQDDTVSFMDMFAQNLKDARKTGTKAADKKRDGAADSKAQEMGDTGRNQASVDQGKKSESSEPVSYTHLRFLLIFSRIIWVLLPQSLRNGSTFL